jgi:hypothetical protein
MSEAGKQEIARLQGQLAERLQAERLVFEASLDVARRAAARDLEAFKVDLQLASEVRRQVAARKVAALVEIAKIGETLQRDVLNVRPGNPEDRANAMAKVFEYGHLVRSNTFLFEKSVGARFHQYAADLLKAEHELNNKYDASAIERAGAAMEAFLQLARRELGVLDAAVSMENAGPRPKPAP